MHYYAVSLWQHKTFSGTVFCGHSAGNAGTRAEKPISYFVTKLKILYIAKYNDKFDNK